MKGIKHPNVAARPKRGTRKAKILEAWQGGDRSIYEIMQITGYDFDTVHHFIPLPQDPLDDEEE